MDEPITARQLVALASSLTLGTAVSLGALIAAAKYLWPPQSLAGSANERHTNERSCCCCCGCRPRTCGSPPNQKLTPGELYMTDHPFSLSRQVKCGTREAVESPKAALWTTQPMGDGQVAAGTAAQDLRRPLSPPQRGSAVPDLTGVTAEWTLIDSPPGGTAAHSGGGWQGRAAETGESPAALDEGTPAGTFKEGEQGDLLPWGGGDSAGGGTRHTGDGQEEVSGADSCRASPDQLPPPAEALAGRREEDGYDSSPLAPCIWKADPYDTRKRANALSWDDYFMAVAFLSAQRSKDPNRQVGACIVGQDRIILGIGYNGFPRGIPDESLPWSKASPDGDPLKTKYPYVCHAEVNAILNRNQGSSTRQRLYVTMFPCNECAKLIIQAGISEVAYFSAKGPGTSSPSYAASERLLRMAGVKVWQHQPQAKAILLAFK